MPLSRFVLILVVVVAAAGATVWLAATLMAAAVMPGWAAFAAIPFLLAAYVLWRVIADRLGDAEDARYDRIER